MNEQVSGKVVTYCRLRPTCTTPKPGITGLVGSRYIASRASARSGTFVYDTFQFAEGDKQKDGIRFKMPQSELVGGEFGDSSDHAAFSFDGTLGETCSQEEVFERVGSPILESFLKGVNSCICCYGQTGAGKTWTMSGGETFQSRGLVQRTIEGLFDRIEKAGANTAPNVFVSYMEIYNEVIYDLLGETSELQTDLESLPRVTLREDESGYTHTINLTLHAVQSGEEAMNIFMFGNANRMVSSTLMNDASSRSHCIFTIHLESSPESSIVQSCKLNLVDLAGSERVWKTGLSETNLREARYINKSLHHFEQVMHALYQKSNHVPYRNSALTSVLRESLGGTFKTVLIGNVSLDACNFRETLTTCRFIQRCGNIKRVPIQIVSRELEKNKREVQSTNKYSFPLKPCRENQFAFTCDQLSDSEDSVSLRDLQERCGSNMSLFPKNLRKSLIEHIRAHGLDYRVTCVGDLCAIIQVLLAKLTQSDLKRKELEAKLQPETEIIEIEIPNQQWSKSPANLPE